MAVRLETTASAQESTSLKFGWVKKCSVQRRLSGRTEQENPGQLAQPTACRSDEARGGKQRRRSAL